MTKFSRLRIQKREFTILLSQEKEEPMGFWWVLITDR